MTERNLRIAIIGAGARSLEGYCKHFQAFKPAPRFVAIAEPNPTFLQRTLDTLKLDRKDVNIYSSWEELLAKETELDAAVVGTPNHLHHGPAMILLERKVPIVLEKPMAVSEQECYDIHQAATRNQVAVQLGFVLRSAPMYRKIREVLDSGAIGRVISINADEMVGPLVTSILFRGTWRRLKKYSGGAMLEKCCHDMDLLNWMAGSRPVTINSFGGRRTFTPNPALADRCPDCVAKTTCTYARDTDKLVDEHERKMRSYLNEADACIYNLDSDINDYESVQVLYENGVIANFMCNFNASRPKGSRSMTIVGSRGTLWGFIDEPFICHAVTGSREVHEHKIVWDGSGHGGGDRTHSAAFMETALGLRPRPAADTWDGYMSAMMCFAADRSLTEGRRAHLRYSSQDRIELV
jgi:predicted dehydrogenase